MGSIWVRSQTTISDLPYDKNKNLAKLSQLNHFKNSFVVSVYQVGLPLTSEDFRWFCQVYKNLLIRDQNSNFTQEVANLVHRSNVFQASWYFKKQRRDSLGQDRSVYSLFALRGKRKKIFANLWQFNSNGTEKVKILVKAFKVCEDGWHFYADLLTCYLVVGYLYNNFPKLKKLLSSIQL